MPPKPKPKKPRTWSPTPRIVSEGLQQAARLAQAGRMEEAQDRLSDLARRHPDRPEPLGELANLSLDMEDMRGFHWAIERLYRLDPNDPLVAFNLAGSYLQMARPVLSYQAIQRFLENWPDHEQAPAAREMLESLHEPVREIRELTGLTGPDGVEIGAEHERVMLLMSLGEWDEARRTGEQVVRHRPDFVPALNNLSQVYSAVGQTARALETAQRALQLSPGNYHALGNLVRFACLAGRPEEGRKWAEQLLAVTSDDPELLLRKVEALSYLGDDQGIMAVVEAARPLPKVEDNAGLLPHLAAVAALRLGREDEAHELWQQALREAPDMDVARANLEELQYAVGDRSAPWPFGVENWLAPPVLRSIMSDLGPVLESEDAETIARMVRRGLRRHPEVAGVVPALLDRGDPPGRALALEIAISSREPALQEALKVYALGQRGPDEMRMRAVQYLREEGVIPPGIVQMWVQGEWRPLQLLAFEVHREPLRPSGDPTVRRLMEGARRYEAEAKYSDALRLVEGALQLEPESAQLLARLGMLRLLLKQPEEAAQLFGRAREQDPDEFLAAAGLSLLATERGDLDEAERLLGPLVSRSRLEQGELGALCAAQVSVQLAHNRVESARSWLNMWEGLDPQNPELERYRMRVEGSGGQ